tara:strand:- start:75 stop:1073 length:999 start_codon:yes stop_codon:yes gene_type:complete
MKNNNNLKQVLPILLALLIIVLLVISWKYWNNNVVEGFESNLDNIFNKKENLTKEEIDYINSYAKIDRNNKNTKKNKLVITAIYCNEDNYIEEWLDYHLNKIKVIDHIYLYSNCKENDLNKLRKYIDDGKLTLIIFDHILKKGIGYLNRKPQYFSLIHNYNNFKNEYEYVLHIDIDEFLIVKDNIKFIKYLDDSKYVGNFKINRYNFSGENRLTQPDNVIKSYLHREKNPSSYKSIGRKTNIIEYKNNKNNIIDTYIEPNYIASCHEFITNLKSSTIPSNICKINHYILKSKEEYLKRPKNLSGSRTSKDNTWDILNKKYHQTNDNDILLAI